MNLISKPNHFPTLSILFAPFLALFLLSFDWLDFNHFLFTVMFFIFCNLCFALALNWALLWQSAERFRLWILIISTIALCTAITAWQVHYGFKRFDYFFDNYQILICFYLSIVCQSIILLGIAHYEKCAPLSADENLLLHANRYLASAALLSIFAALMALILGLGFALLSLLGLNLSANSLLVILGFALGTLPIFLLLIPIKSRPYPFPYLHVFQWIALGFISAYLLITLFQFEININSGIRLTMAAVLWLLAILSYDSKQPRIGLNLATTSAGIILILMSLYGIGIRLNTQGMTEARLSAFAIALLLFIGYLGLGIKALLKPKTPSAYGKTYTMTLALLTIAIALLSLLPLPNWSLADQLARYLDGRKSASQLSGERYFFSQYGQAGHEALMQIAKHYQIDVDQANNTYEQHSSLEYQLWRKQIGNIDEYFLTVPEDLALPDILRERVLENLWKSNKALLLSKEALSEPIFLITAVDADRNPETAEYLVWSKYWENYDTLHHYHFIPSHKNSPNNEENNIQLENIIISSYPNKSSDEIIALIKQGIRYHQPQYLYHNIILGTDEAPIKLELPKIEMEK